jgi:hypothetical protein
MCVTEFSMRVENRTSSNVTGADGLLPTTTTYIYSALLADNVTTLEQSFAFHTEPQATDFAGVSFNIAPGSLKWSINLTTAAAADGQQQQGSGQPLTVRYKLSSLGVNVTTSSSSNNNASVNATRQDNKPHANMTTYQFPLHTSSSSPSGSSGDQLVVKVVVFDVAEVDGAFAPLVGHSVQLSDNSSSSSAGGADYVLVLQFPAFNRSLYYDPSLGLGVLVGSKASGRGSTAGGGTSSALFVAMGVAVPVAVLTVVAVVVIATVVAMRKRKQHRIKQVHRVHALSLPQNIIDHVGSPCPDSYQPRYK